MQWFSRIAYVVLFLSLSLNLAFYIALKDYYSKEQEAKKQAMLEEQHCIIEALWHEARGEGSEGLVAVASVIDNRKNHPDYPATYCGVIKQSKQFSYTLMNKPSAKRLEASRSVQNDPVYVEIQQLSQKMLEGDFKPSLGSRVLWYTTHKVKNQWTKTKMIVKKIGNHRFYSDKE